MVSSEFCPREQQELGAFLIVLRGGERPGRRGHRRAGQRATEPWSGTHTSVTGSVSSVKFRQTDLEMVTPVQSAQSPGSVRTVFSQFSSVSSVSDPELPY